MSRRKRRVFRHRRSGRAIGEHVVTSIHEAGHVIAALALGLGVVAAGLQGDDGDGFTEHGRSLRWLYDALNRPNALDAGRGMRLSAKRRGQLRAHVDVSLAGHVAEGLLLGGRASQRWESSADWTDAEVGARLLGRSPAYIACRRAEVRRLLVARWPEVQAVARALRQRTRGWTWRAVRGRELRAVARAAREGR